MGDMPNGNIWSSTNRANKIFVLQSHNSKERAFASPIRANDTNFRSGIKRKPDVFKNLFLSISLDKIFDCKNVIV